LRAGPDPCGLGALERASAAAAAIHTKADTLEDLHREIPGAVVCHFDPGQAPSLIRLHHVRQERLAL
jgi:hypothetical protein